MIDQQQIVIIRASLNNPFFFLYLCIMRSYSWERLTWFHNSYLWMRCMKHFCERRNVHSVSRSWDKEKSESLTLFELTTLNYHLSALTTGRLVEGEALQGSYFHAANVNNVKSVLLPEQSNPSPLYPDLQVQLNDPTVFWQFALAWQPPLLELHSSISTG